MLLDVTLADHATHWRFAGTQEFSRWLSETPWLKEGGVCIMHLPGRNDGHHFAECVVRNVHGYDAGCSNIRSEIVWGSELLDGLQTGLAAHFHVPIEAAPWQIREALSRLFAERPLLVVVTPTGAAIDRDLWQEASAIKDEMSKSDCPSYPTFILLDNGDQRLNGRRIFDFRRGKPVFGVLDYPGWDDFAVWNAYVHVRLAWEAGGDPLLANDMYSSMYEQLRVGRDDILEEKLNQWAIAALQGLSSEQSDLLNYYLSRRHRMDVQTKQKGSTLEYAGLVWRSQRAHSYLPTPWVARALLYREQYHEQCWLLRSALVCVPLVHELLSHCQDFEQRLKASAQGAPAQDGSDVPEKIYKLWERFREGQDATTIYPEGHPSPPDRPVDAWIFASLGQFLFSEGSPLGRHHTNSELILSRLRNTLAHGHYVSWAHVKMMRDIIQTISL